MEQGSKEGTKAVAGISGLDHSLPVFIAHVSSPLQIPFGRGLCYYLQFRGGPCWLAALAEL